MMTNLLVDCIGLPTTSFSLADARAALERIGRYESNPTFDQCPATLETVLRRVDLLTTLATRGQCENLLLLGDDDFLSVGLVAAGFSNSITVVDIDLNILDLIDRATSGGAHSVLADLRSGLPKSLTSSYDVVFADPPYTLAGQLVFTSCALRALRLRGQLRIFLCGSDFYLREEELDVIESYFRSAGFTLEGYLKDFNEYPAPGDVQQDMAKVTGSFPETFFSSIRCFKATSRRHVRQLRFESPVDIYSYGESYGTA
jgi:predicted methyltransferase